MRSLPALIWTPSAARRHDGGMHAWGHPGCPAEGIYTCQWTPSMGRGRRQPQRERQRHLLPLTPTLALTDVDAPPSALLSPSHPRHLPRTHHRSNPVTLPKPGTVLPHTTQPPFKSTLRAARRGWASHVVASDSSDFLAFSLLLVLDLGPPVFVTSCCPLCSACHGHCNTNTAGTPNHTEGTLS